MDIVNSHYVPLQPPYPIIYYRGQVGMQTGSLIVLASLDSPRLGVKQPSTMTYPVVSTLDKKKCPPSCISQFQGWAENLVWHTDVQNTYFLCFNDVFEIDLLGFIPHERLRNVIGSSSGFSLKSMMDQLLRFGIRVGKSIYPSTGKATIFLSEGRFDVNKAVLTSNIVLGEAGVHIAVKVGDTDQIFKDISSQIDDYHAAVGEKLEIEFRCKDEKYAELISLLNKKYGK